MFIASYGLVSGSTGKTLGEISADDKARAQVQEIMQEIYHIAKEKNIKLPSTIIEDSIARANNFPFETKTSYQRDIEFKGNVNEGDLYGGTIIRQGKLLNIPTPAAGAVFAEIQNRLGQ